VEVRHDGGAVNRAPADGSAFGHPDMEFILFLLAVVLDPAGDRAIDQDMRDAVFVIQPYQIGQIYLNFLIDSDITTERYARPSRRRPTRGWWR
jgi:hypothetical protein